MNAQEFFNKVWERAKIKQKCYRYPDQVNMGRTSCAYRSPNASAPPCFGGVCIPDEEFNPEMEGKSLARMSNMGILPVSLLGIDVEFMQECQNVHDRFEPSDWERLLRITAANRDLTVPA